MLVDGEIEFIPSAPEELKQIDEHARLYQLTLESSVGISRRDLEGLDCTVNSGITSDVIRRFMSQR